MRPRILPVAVALAAWACTMGLAAQEVPPTEYTVLPEDSRLRIHVGTAGIFGFLGHEHLVEARGFRGHVLWDANARASFDLELTFDSDSIVVLDPDLPEQKRAKVQEDMETEVLEVGEHPSIVFRATSFRPAAETASAESFEGTVTGTLELRGARRTLEVPVTVETAAGELRGRGEVTIKGSHFGIEQVRAGAGTVKTKDALRISFDLVARPTSAGRQSGPETE